MAKTLTVRAKPPEPARRYDWEAIAEELRADPNEWHLVFTQDRHSLVIAINKGNIAAFNKSNEFHVKTRANANRNGDGPRMCDLYMQYVPNKKGAK